MSPATLEYKKPSMLMQCSLMSSRLFADGKERKWLCNHLNLNFDENMSIDQISFAS